MTTQYIDTHIKRLALAREAAQLGGRFKVVAQLSCLRHRECRRLFTPVGERKRRGNHLTSDNWAVEASLLNRVEAAIFCNLYERLRIAGHGASVAMVAAYREFASSYQPIIHDRKRIERSQSGEMLTFDRAFHLVANLRLQCPPDPALWLRPDPKYSLVTCPDCSARTVHSPSDVFRCPMCRFVHRLKLDPRLQHVMALAEHLNRDFRAAPLPGVFADILALRPSGASQPARAA